MRAGKRGREKVWGRGGGMEGGEDRQGREEGIGGVEGIAADRMM